MYTYCLRAAESEETFYDTYISSLGYNSSLDLDEAVPFALRVYTSTNGVLKDFKALAYSRSSLHSALLKSIINNGKKEVVAKKLHLYIHRSGDCRVSMALENRSKLPVNLVRT